MRLHEVPRRKDHIGPFSLLPKDLREIVIAGLKRDHKQRFAKRKERARQGWQMRVRA